MCDDDKTQRAVMSYDPVANTWTQLGLLPASRSTTVSEIINGKLIVTTENSPGATNTVWIGTLS